MLTDAIIYDRKGVRVESGPIPTTVIATPEYLDNTRTADHYSVGSLDALGEVIELGKEMTFLEWGTKDVPRVLGYYLYATDETGRYVQLQLFKDDERDVAIAAANAVAAERKA